MNVATLQVRGHAGAAVLDEVHLYARVLPPIPRKETCEQGLHRLRRGAHPEHARLPALERPRALTERLGVGQQAVGPLQKILALRGELDAPPDPVEEVDVQ